MSVSTIGAPVDPDKLLTPGEVADLLRIKLSTLAEWRSRGYGPAHRRLGHRTIRYRREDLAGWVAEQDTT